MINHDKALKLQAYLDNELSANEAGQISEWLARDDEARAVFEELRNTKSLISGNELDLKVAETREFYWSKIAREIARPSAGPTTAPQEGTWRYWWQRFAAPLAGAALLVTLFVFTLNQFNGFGRGGNSFQEIETPFEEANSISFHSQAAGMTFVWISSEDRQEEQED
jgi:negative regulator of sigma E activity